ncbi:MAG: hypothetical protein ACI30C_02305, partial [Muribaculaceae bacterium]
MYSNPIFLQKVTRAGLCSFPPLVKTGISISFKSNSSLSPLYIGSTYLWNAEPKDMLREVDFSVPPLAKLIMASTKQFILS